MRDPGRIFTLASQLPKEHLVVLDLPGGASVAALITNESAVALGLAVGSAATAVFKASSVIVGVSA